MVDVGPIANDADEQLSLDAYVETWPHDSFGIPELQAFKAGHYEEAVGHFQNSIALDPNYESARLYLATAYSYQVVPNLDTPENLATAKKAMDGFNEVLAKTPNDLDLRAQVTANLHRLEPDTTVLAQNRHFRPLRAKNQRRLRQVQDILAGWNMKMHFGEIPWHQHVVGRCVRTRRGLDRDAL